ncbi:unnamed protein product, partial [Iphiclides podalirius]
MANRKTRNNPSPRMLQWKLNRIKRIVRPTVEELLLALRRHVTRAKTGAPVQLRRPAGAGGVRSAIVFVAAFFRGAANGGRAGSSLGALGPTGRPLATPPLRHSATVPLRHVPQLLRNSLTRRRRRQVATRFVAAAPRLNLFPSEFGGNACSPVWSADKGRFTRDGGRRDEGVAAARRTPAPYLPTSCALSSPCYELTSSVASGAGHQHLFLGRSAIQQPQPICHVPLIP